MRFAAKVPAGERFAGTVAQTAGRVARLATAPHFGKYTPHARVGVLGAAVAPEVSSRVAQAGDVLHKMQDVPVPAVSDWSKAVTDDPLGLAWRLATSKSSPEEVALSRGLARYTGFQVADAVRGFGHFDKTNPLSYITTALRPAVKPMIQAVDPVLPKMDWKNELARVAGELVETKR